MTTQCFGPAELRAAATAGIRAPSQHNSQPWRFRLRDGAIEVLASPRNYLPAADRVGWAARVACGAAAFNARLALLAHGTPADIEVRPDPADPKVMVRLRPGSPRPSTCAEDLLFAAIGHRYSNRQPFRPDPVPADIRVRLDEAARAQGAWLEMLIGATAFSAFAQIAESAGRVLHRDPRYHPDSSRWTFTESANDAVLQLAGTRFGEPPDLWFPTVRGNPPYAAGGDIDPEPLIAILGCSGDTAADQINAGQALQRVLLTATDAGLATTMISQPIEAAVAREQLSRSLGRRSGAPQMALRIGYGRHGCPTPRRHLARAMVS